MRNEAGKVIIVAKERVGALSAQLGQAEEVLTFMGELFL
jgi:hypothetical protein